MQARLTIQKNLKTTKYFQTCVPREEATYQLDLKSRSLVEFRALKTKIDAAKE